MPLSQQPPPPPRPPGPPLLRAGLGGSAPRGRIAKGLWSRRCGRCPPPAAGDSPPCRATPRPGGRRLRRAGGGEGSGGSSGGSRLRRSLPAPRNPDLPPPLPPAAPSASRASSSRRPRRRGPGGCLGGPGRGPVRRRLGSARPGPGGVHAPAARGAHQQHALFPDGDHGRDGDAGVLLRVHGHVHRERARLLLPRQRLPQALPGPGGQQRRAPGAPLLAGRRGPRARGKSGGARPHPDSPLSLSAPRLRGCGLAEVAARQPLPSKFLQVAGGPFPRGHSARARRGRGRRKPPSSPHLLPPHSPRRRHCWVTQRGWGDGREGGSGR